jgi:hypothetical protein
MYKLNRSIVTGEINSVSTTQGNLTLTIPFDPANTDYQAYLKWVSEGNKPEQAD